MKLKILLVSFTIVVTGYGVISAQQQVLPSPQQVLCQEMEQIIVFNFIPYFHPLNFIMNSTQDCGNFSKNAPILAICPI